jgi:hypothetical protein
VNWQPPTLPSAEDIIVVVHPLKVHLGPNCFGDSDKYNLYYLMLDQDVRRTQVNETLMV